jgi:hypothetical protein
VLLRRTLDSRICLSDPGRRLLIPARDPAPRGTTPDLGGGRKGACREPPRGSGPSRRRRRRAMPRLAAGRCPRFSHHGPRYQKGRRWTRMGTRPRMVGGPSPIRSGKGPFARTSSTCSATNRVTPPRLSSSSGCDPWRGRRDVRRVLRNAPERRACTRAEGSTPGRSVSPFPRRDTGWPWTTSGDVVSFGILRTPRRSGGRDPAVRPRDHTSVPGADVTSEPVPPGGPCGAGRG